MAKKKWNNQTVKQYNKELKRIKQFIRRAEKRGYQFEDNIIPKKPKKITQGSVRKLKKINPDYLYKKSVYGGEATQGEIVTGLAGRKAERKLSAKRASYTRKLNKSAKKDTQTSTFTPPYKVSEDGSFYDNVTISGFRYHVKQFNERASEMLLSWLDRLLSTHDKHDVAVMLNEGAENGNIVNYQIVYSRDRLIEYMSNMLDYLPDEGELFKEQFMEAMEYEEDYSDPV